MQPNARKRFHHALRDRLAHGPPIGQPGGIPVDVGHAQRRGRLAPAARAVRVQALTSRHGKLSPERRGLSSASPKAKLSGGVQLSLRKVSLSVLRGKP